MDRFAPGSRHGRKPSISIYLGQNKNEGRSTTTQKDAEEKAPPTQRGRGKQLPPKKRRRNAAPLHTRRESSTAHKEEGEGKATPAQRMGNAAPFVDGAAFLPLLFWSVSVFTILVWRVMRSPCVVQPYAPPPFVWCCRFLPLLGRCCLTVFKDHLNYSLHILKRNV